MSKSKLGKIPKDWYLTESEAVKFWGSATLAHIMEMPAKKRMNLNLSDSPYKDNKYVYSWGVPDFGSARTMCGISEEDFCDFFGFPEAALAVMELGISSPGFSSLVGMADALQWPLAVFFRNGHELHRVTKLSRKVNEVAQGGRIDEDLL